MLLSATQVRTHKQLASRQSSALDGVSMKKGGPSGADECLKDGVSQTGARQLPQDSNMQEKQPAK